MLVLAHANRLRRNFHEFSQRVLKAAAKAHRAAYSHVEVGVFLACQFRCRIHRGAGFVHDGIAQIGRLLGDEFRHHLLGFAACGAVADHDGVHAVFLREARQLALGARHIAARLGGVDHAVVEQLARFVHHGNFAAGSISRVERQHARAAHGAGRQKAFKVFGEHVDSLGLRAHGELRAGLAFERRRHEALVAIGDGGIEHGREHAVAAWPAGAQACGGFVGVDVHAHTQLALALAAVNREHAVVGNLAQGLVVVVVRLVRSRLVGVSGFDHDVGGVVSEGAQVGDAFRVFRDGFGNDVARARERCLGRVEAGFFRYICCGRVEGRAFRGRLHNDHVRERLEPRFARFLRARQALFAERLVEVFNALQLLSFADLSLELGRELALGVNERDDVFFSLLKVAQIRQPLVERAQRDVVHAAGGFFAVARDEGNGIALVDELDGRFDVVGLQIELARELFNQIHRAPLNCGALIVRAPFRRLRVCCPNVLNARNLLNARSV